MKRKSSAILLFAIGMAFAGLLCLCSCASWSGDNSDKDFTNIFDRFTEEGLVVDYYSPLNYEIPHADSAVCVSIAGHKFGIYKYNIKVNKQRERITRIKENGWIGLLGKQCNATVNGAFVLTDYDDHPQKDKIISAFKSF